MNAVQTNAIPVVATSTDGDARWWFESLAVIKLRGSHTNGQFTLIEITEPPGAATPLHVHWKEDETFILLEGSATFEIGDQIVEAHAGDVLYGPRAVPHRFTAGALGCKMHFLVTPAGFEDMVEEMSEPALRRELPPPPSAEPDWARIAAIATAHGNELLG